MVSGREPVSAARAANGFARRQSRTRCFLEAATNAKALARLLESDLRKAFSGGEFETFYQPLFHLAGGVVSGSEVLLRWRHPERELVSPTEFIPLAEETG
jgi:sensor c-di-GMP phosphodiesterase-like protein